MAEDWLRAPNVIRVTIPKQFYHLSYSVILWCIRQFDDSDWWTETFFGNTTFAFKKEDQYILFMLRWGHLSTDRRSL